MIAETWEDARARNAKKAGVPVSKARVASGFWAKLVKQQLTTHRGLLSVRLQEFSERVEAEELDAAEKGAHEQAASETRSDAAYEARSHWPVSHQLV